MTARTGSRHEPFSQITNRFLPSNRRKLPFFQEKINNYLTAQTGSPNQKVLEFRKSIIRIGGLNKVIKQTTKELY